MSDPGSRTKIIWIVALVGMCVVPLGGLVWAAIGGGPASDETEETADGEISADTDEAGASGAATTKKTRKKRRKKTKTASSSRKVTHEAAACCEALRTAGKEESDVSRRPTFLAAASACEAAPTATRAMTQVRSIVEGSKLDLPGACEE